MIDYNFKLRGDLGVGEMSFEYDDSRVYICDILELEDGKIARAMAYFGEPCEAPAWRAQRVERL